MSLLTSLCDDLPNSTDQALAFAYRREGARLVFNEVFNWEPQSVRDEKLKEEREASNEA